ncbi:Clavaminate synthase-like protein [Pisolithus orientalis]|uniref:Clavaminate synthase-like protein n=1 Tax=Pisolithus orientalis TaxID=936130 RepID=UPI002224786B|nr:Clavaminate synthase-like protein [Pisolithus orientalis]KAI6019698.1 Clavaminate synthase-like protein [Pisolithus orientalis]
MARSKRRTTRSAAQKKQQKEPAPPSPSPVSSRSSLTPMQDDEPVVPTPTSEPIEPLGRSQEETCPDCKDHQASEVDPTTKDSWIRCDACKTWYHWVCAGNGGDPDAIDKWYCKPCVLEKPSRTITLKPPARKSTRKRTQLNYANLNSGVDSDPTRWLRVIQSKSIQDDQFKRMNGADVGIEWLENDSNAMREPIVIESPEGLGMKMPSQDCTVTDVANMVGRETPVEVIDVASQSTSPGWTLGKWADYYNLESSARDKIRNVISLEISSTPLADQITPPRLVRELDWVEKFWPSSRKGKGHAYPKVQLYCLMGVASAWTDWHIDFAGSSVYYHILRGSKVFYFIRPTPANLAAYERWSGTELQSNVWLGDMVDEVVKVTLTAGNTMIIPTGWIHAVHTPVDSLVIGGNFLHSYNVATQLKVLEIEKATHVPKKFRFPMFTKLCWYVGEKYLRDLKAKEEFCPRVMESLEVLSGYLVSEARVMERGTEAAKRDARDQVPTDRVKDPSALARELRWRIRINAGTTSDDEELGRPAKKTLVNGHGIKRKRSPVELPGGPVLFKNFQPKEWDVVLDLLNEEDSRRVAAPYPSDDGWQQQWSHWGDESLDSNTHQAASVERKRNVIAKTRRIDGGLERQRIERVFERWVWEDGPVDMKPVDGDVTMAVATTESVGGMDVDTPEDTPALKQEEEEPEEVVKVDGSAVTVAA